MSILRIRYANQLAISEFDLQDQVNLMKGEAAILKAILGNTTQLDGFVCTPNSPLGLSVIVGEGTITINQDVLNTALGELPTQIPADTTEQIVKYAYTLDPSVINIVPPGTPGFSQNDLIQISFSEADGNPVSIPFYNGQTGGVLNPPVFATKNTQRIDSVVLSLKPGVPATTGTQTTPSPDAGYVGAWVVTVANGQTTITSGDIAMYSGAPFIIEKLKDKVSVATGNALWAQLAVNNTFTQPQTIPVIASSVYLSGSTQTIPATNITTKFLPNTTEFDYGTLWNATTKRYEITTKGLYEIKARIYYGAQGTTAIGSAFITLVLNGTDYKRLGEGFTDNYDVTISGSCQVELSPGDYVELFLNLNATQNVNAGGGSLQYNSFEIRYLGSI